MTMSLVGTLSCPNKPSDTEVEVENKSLINVGVSLEEGLRLWGKDAGFGESSSLRYLSDSSSCPRS
jgi:hypothetical protein